MAEKTSFDKVAVRRETKRKIEILAIYHGPIVDYVESLIDLEWKKAENEGRVNDLMLAEPVGEQPPAELTAAYSARPQP